MLEDHSDAGADRFEKCAVLRAERRESVGIDVDLTQNFSIPENGNHDLGANIRAAG